MARGKKMTGSERRALIEGKACERRKVFKELLTHLERGLSVDCFGALSDTSIRSYLKLYPEEFKQEEFDEALRKGKQWWENCGNRQANGECLGNSRTWYYNMANRYGWREKLEIEAEHKGNIAVQVVSYASAKASRDAEKDK
jgi:hypothetical protein